MPNEKADFANYFRAHYNLPLNANDDEIVDYVHQFYPQQAQSVQRAILTKPSAQAEGYAGDSGFQPQASDLSETLKGASDLGSRLASKVPGMELIGRAGQTVAKVGDTIDAVVNAARPGTKTFGTMGAGEAARASLPQGPGSALMAVAPLVGEAASGLLPAVEAGGALAEGGAAKFLASAGKAATGAPEATFSRVLSDPYRLSRARQLMEASGTDSAKQAAGEVMNRVAAQYGVKTGEEALKAIPGYSAKATPSLADAVPFANEVHNNLDKIDELEKLKAAKQEISSKLFGSQDLQRLGELAAKPIESMSPSGQALSDLGKLGMRPANAEIRAGEEPLRENLGLWSQEPSPAGSFPTKDLRNFVMEQLKEQAELSKKYSITKARISELEKPVLEGGAPTLQDLVSARQVMTKRLSKPMFQNPLEAPSAKTGTENIHKIDDAIDNITSKLPPVKPIEVPGYGKVSSLPEARDIWSEAADHDELRALTPVNANKSPSVLRSWGAGAGLATGIGTSMATGSPLPALAAGGMAAATSPRAWAAAIRATTLLRDLGIGLGEGAEAGANAGPSVGVLSNIVGKMSNEEPVK